MRRASATVGWQCMAPLSSSSVASSLMASAASSMRSVARSARMCTPRISPYLAPATTFIMPSVAPLTRLRPFALVGKRPTLYSMPSSLQRSSVRPTQANSGPT